MLGQSMLQREEEAEEERERACFYRVLLGAGDGAVQASKDQSSVQDQERCVQEK